MSGLRTQAGLEGQKQQGHGRSDGRLGHAAGLVTHVRTMDHGAATKVHRDFEREMGTSAAASYKAPYRRPTDGTGTGFNSVNHLGTGKWEGIVW
eukprot:SAG22_NODE_35_length_27276_cov_20.395849_20_plen_94_part_00